MPSKIQLDENLVFLYICLQKSDMKTIDFSSVGTATNLNPPAARMRFTRLKRQIEGGLIGNNNSAAIVKSENRIKPRAGKRSKGVLKNEEVINMEECRKMVEVKRGTGLETTKEDTKEKGEKQEVKSEVKIKNEPGINERGFSSTSESGFDFETEDSDSEDEMPLAKRKRKVFDRYEYIPALIPDATKKDQHTDGMYQYRGTHVMGDGHARGESSQGVQTAAGGEEDNGIWDQYRRFWGIEKGYDGKELGC